MSIRLSTILQTFYKFCAPSKRAIIFDKHNKCSCGEDRLYLVASRISR